MRLDVIGTGSSGNSYAITANDGEILILEAGVSLNKVKPVIDFRIENVVGVLITHEHVDHSAFAKSYQDNGIPVYCSYGTAEAIKDSLKVNARKLDVCSEGLHKIGSFRVKTFPVVHDASDPCGYAIYHPDMGWLVFATDCSDIPVSFENNVQHFLIECNYDEQTILDKCNDHQLDTTLFKRVQQSHFSMESCAKWLSGCNLNVSNNVILCHASSGNLMPHKCVKEYFKENTHTSVEVAKNGMSFDLNILPY